MVYENGSFDANLAAAAGDDAMLLAELRTAFVESLERQFDLLKRARCDGNWNVAAMRLKGLGSSFHASELTALAQLALDSAPGEPTVLQKIDRFIIDFSGDNLPSA